MTEKDLEYIQNEFKKKQDRLNKEDIADALSYLRKDNPTAFEKIEKAKQRFDKLLKEAPEGKVPLSKVEDALGKWYLLSLEATVRYHKQSEKKERQVAKAKRRLRKYEVS